MGERRTRYERLKIDSNLFNPENVQIRTVLGGGGREGFIHENTLSRSGLVIK